MPNTIPQPILDSHLHVWDVQRFNLPWLAGANPTINRTFTTADFDQDAVGLNIDRIIYIEVDIAPEQQTLEATSAIEMCRDPGNRVAAAVIGGYPHDEGFREYLGRFADEECVKGVRMVLHTPDRPPNLCLEPNFVSSMKYLGDVNLSFDLCMRRAELHSGAELAAKCPGTQFVLDHCGGIGGGEIPPEVRKPWQEGIKAMADQENVVCKISGLVDPGLRENWTPDDLAESVNFCLDAFGEDRVLFGGDWPVCLLGDSYKSWAEALSAVTSNRSETFRRKLFHDNAARVYRM